MNAISTINIELTSRCNSNCFCCGRRKLEKDNPDYASTLGDMTDDVYYKIINQIDPYTLTQLHWNGEPTLAPGLDAKIWYAKALGLFTALNTNGLLLVKQQKALNTLHSLTVSVIAGDDPAKHEEQAKQISRYLLQKPEGTPVFNLRFLGQPIPGCFYDISKAMEKHNVNIVTRVLHSPEMSRDYERKVTMPEIGVCLDLLHHPAIDRHGDVYPCVRNNPEGLNKLGNVMEAPLDRILNSQKRLAMIEDHFNGRRNQVPLCRDCHFYGVPTGW